MNSQNSAIATGTQLPKLISKVFVYDIDAANSAPKSSSQNVASLPGLEDFLKKLADDAVKSNNTKQFVFNANSTVEPLFQRYLAAADESTAQPISRQIAEQLLQAEKKTSGKVAHLNKGLKKGSMVICHYTASALDCLIVTKLDFESFLERDTYDKKQGLPEKNGVLKSCIIKVSNGKLEKEIELLDSNGTISSFWSNLFLESKPKIDDVVNTKNAFREISRTFIGLSRTSKVDYQQLKNNLISYFSTNSSFVLDDLLDCLVGSYKPISDKVDLDDIKDKIKNLVSTKVFDGNFTIDDAEIKKNYKHTFKLDGGVTITTQQSFNDRIFKKTINGDSYVLIKTKTGLDEIRDYPTNS